MSARRRFPVLRLQLRKLDFSFPWSAHAQPGGGTRGKARPVMSVLQPGIRTATRTGPARSRDGERSGSLSARARGRRYSRRRLRNVDRGNRRVRRFVSRRKVRIDRGQCRRFARKRSFFTDALIRFGHQLLDPLPQNGEDRVFVIRQLDVMPPNRRRMSCLPLLSGAPRYVDLRELVVETKHLHDVTLLARLLEPAADNRGRLGHVLDVPLDLRELLLGSQDHALLEPDLSSRRGRRRGRHGRRPSLWRLSSLSTCR